MATILIADDNSNIHKMVELALKDLGYKIEKVGNGEHAVRKLPEIFPDLILADIFMPVRNGYEVCEFVKGNEKFQHIPVVLLQGKFDPVDEHEVKRVRADGLLMKPFVPPDPLIKMVQTLLEESARLRAVAAAAPPSAKPGSTVQMTPTEIATLTGERAAPPEPEIADYAVATKPVEFAEGEQPMAFGDLLETAPAETAEEEEEKPVAGKEERFVASSVAAMSFGEEPAAPVAEEAEAAEATPSHGGIVEELKQPSPDEPPIKVDFSGQSEPLELVTDETPSAVSYVSAEPLPDLATSPDEWMSSGPSKAAVPPDAGESWVSAPPAEAPPPSASDTLVAPPEPAWVSEVRQTPPPAAEPPAAVAAAPIEIPAPPVAEAVAEEPAPAAEIPSFVASIPAPVEAAAPPEIRTVAAAAPVDPALLEAVVQKVVERLQPHIIEQITREIVRPLAEALLRKEKEK